METGGTPPSRIPNVSGLIDAITGTTTGNFEYGPFGETIRLTPTANNLSPFRFSTKYQDEETDLLYYGYRYYNPSMGRWLSRDPMGEDGGLNLHNFVANDPIANVDILGLAQLWTFSGINSWSGGGYQNYVAIELRKYWNAYPGSQEQFVSQSGLKPLHYWLPNDSLFMGTPWSEQTLNKEAQEMAMHRVQPGQLCCKKIAVLMIAPKTHGIPPLDSCCKNITVQTYYNPLDAVPNQGIFGSLESNNFWSQRGGVNAVYTGHVLFGNHNFGPFVDPNNHLIPMMPNPNPRPQTTHGATLLMYQNYVRSDQPFQAPRALLDRWVNDPNIDFVFVCHSQGCNIAMQVLQQGCNKTK